MNHRIIILFLCLLFSFSVFAEERTFQFNDTGPDIRVPSQIWDMIQGAGASGESVTFAPMKVHFQEKTKGVLIEPEFTIELPRGGGEIDLSKFVNDQQGTFRVYFDLAEFAEGKNLRIFYVSRAKKRNLDGEIWGAGCHKFMDLQDFLLKAGKTHGIEVNTTRNRHDTVLGGHFIFASGHQVTQVTFTDSHQPQLFCDVSSAKDGKSENKKGADKE